MAYVPLPDFAPLAPLAPRAPNAPHVPHSSHAPPPLAPPSPISCIDFAPSNILFVAAHDALLRLYSCCDNLGSISPKLAASIPAPSTVLAAAHTAHCTYVAGADGSVRQFDQENMRMTSSWLPVSETSPVTHVSSADGSVLVCGAVDGSIYYIDPRMGRLADKVSASAKILAMDASSTYSTVGVAGGRVLIYDIRSRAAPWQVRSSGLKHQMSCIRSNVSSDGYAVSSIDGRVSMEFYDPLSEAQDRKFAFKCHRHKDPANNRDIVYPVTLLRFHPIHNTLFTAGGDGHVCIWNWTSRKRIKQFPQLPLPFFVSHMDIARDGRLLAVATIDDSFLRARDVAVLGGVSRVYLRLI